MPDCDYCSESFEDEDRYLRHLASAHGAELSRLDQRRVERIEHEASSLDTGVVALGVILLGATVVVGFLVLEGTGGGSGGEHHEHGTMEIVADGEPVDLTASQFVNRNAPFHFHGPQDALGNGTALWHTHADGITLQEALGTLGIEVDSAGTELRIGGDTYRAGDPATDLVITVDGQPVEPGEHVLSGVEESRARNGEGDTVRIVVDTDG
ncbi:MAG: hypothetical protein V5A25_05030 [Halovenus sp.]